MLYKWYFTIHFRYYIVGATLVFHVAALILLVSARLLYRSPEKDDEEEVEMEPIVNAVTTWCTKKHEEREDTIIIVNLFVIIFTLYNEEFSKMVYFLSP